MNPDATAADAAAVLARVTARLPGSEDRPGQLRMVELVADAIHTKRHLVVQAGTGTGKTLAYLVPAILAQVPTVVATATKALQDQLATKDLPFLAERLATDLDVEFDWAVLKGRNNYLCLQRLREVTAPADGQLELEPMAETVRVEVKRLAEWSGHTASGDQAELSWTPSDAAWRSVSVGSDECPGADRCPQGSACFAEAARHRASASDVVVVNTYLYGLDVGSGGAILPPHDLVVFDEAHVLEDVMSDTVGVQLAPGRFTTLAATIRRIVADDAIGSAVADLAGTLRGALAPHAGKRLDVPLPAGVDDALGEARTTLGRVAEVLSAIETPVDEAAQRKLRAQVMNGRTIEALEVARSGREGTVAFVSGRPDAPRLEIAPLDVGPTLAERVWSERTAVLTSATIPISLPTRVGLPADEADVADVGSPFDYAASSMLYCAMHLPDPRSPDFRAGVHDELTALITAAGGRTLALFTSWAAMDEAAAAVRERVPHRLLTQRDLPKPALVEAFAVDEATCLFATAGLFQGIDVPGPTLSLVVIDRLPFPRPDDPLLSARRETLGREAFGQIDLPRATMLLAQAAGRLIRSRTDRGVVAVMDPRLGTARYRWDIIGALPPMRRTRERAEVEQFLRGITG
ncbi:MAG: ATP-dependent DNA helicase [Ilumatobacteraceae bacterium]